MSQDGMTPDPTGTALVGAAVVYFVKAVLDEIRQYRKIGASNGDSVARAELKLIEYKIEEMQKDREYNSKWRHWMANQMQRLMAKQGLECDQMPQ